MPLHLRRKNWNFGIGTFHQAFLAKQIGRRFFFWKAGDVEVSVKKIGGWLRRVRSQDAFCLARFFTLSCFWIQEFTLEFGPRFAMVL